MTAKRIPMFIFVLLTSACVIAGAPVMDDGVIDSLQFPLTIRDVKSRFGNGSQGHGPYIWFEGQSKNDEQVWFWYLPTGPDDELDSLRVAFITFVNAQKTDMQRVVWPKDLKGKPVGDVSKSIYEKYTRKRQ